MTTHPFARRSAALAALVAGAVAVAGAPAMAASEPKIAVSIDDANTVVEPPAGSVDFAVFTVRLSQPADHDVKVTVTTFDRTATAATRDYKSVIGPIVIEKGAERAQLLVPVLGDSLFEGTETFGVELTEPRGAVLGDALASGRIADGH